MSGRAATLIGLGFAALWLWLGAGALGAPWTAIVGTAGTFLLGLIGIAAWRRPTSSAQRFIRSRYRLAVLGELAGFALVAWWMSTEQAEAYLWPAVGMVVGLHFIGLWWASGRQRFLALSAGMTAINLAAFALPTGLAMAVSGLGSAAALALTIAWP